MKKQLCLHCGDPFSGRADKKFCSESCRSTHFYYHNQKKEDSLFKKIDKQLKGNRRILKGFNRAGKASVRSRYYLKKDLILNTSPTIGKQKMEMYICFAMSTAL